MDFIQKFEAGVFGNEVTVTVQDYEEFQAVINVLKKHQYRWKKSGELVDSFNAYAERLNNGTKCFIIIRRNKTVSYSSNEDLVLRKHPNISDYVKSDWKTNFVYRHGANDIYTSKKLSAVKENVNSTKGEKKMKTNGIKKMFENAMNFGFVSGDVKLSPFGIAVRNTANNYVSYDAERNEIVSVEGLTFDIDHAIMKMPVAVTALAVGDTIMYNNAVYVVRSVKGFDVKGLNLRTQSVQTIKYAKSPFGINFMTKLVTLFNMNGTQNEAGNMMLPLLLSDKMDTNDMFTIMALGGFGGANGANMFGGMNPMMLALMAGDSNDGDDFSAKDLMMMSMFMGQQNPFGSMFGTPTTPTATPTTPKEPVTTDNVSDSTTSDIEDDA